MTPLIVLAAFATLATSTSVPFGKRTTAASITVTSLTQCPDIAPRSSAAQSVHDLRPDDFSVVMAVGDSITAGALAKGILPSTNDTLSEWRGVSFGGGGDNGALTIPNLIKYYSPTLQGGAVGHHGAEACSGVLCPIGPFDWNTTVDQLDGALSGAISSNLLHMVKDYLVPQVEARNITASAFKYLNLQIGSNELCQLCPGGYTLALTPAGADAFEENVRVAMEYVRTHIPNTVVNVMGQLHVSDIYALTLNQPYCALYVRTRPYETPDADLRVQCALLPGSLGDVTRALMDDLQTEFDARLLKIVQDYQRKNYTDFAAIWQPLPVPLAQYPIYALSDVDCFHPSEKFHGVLAAAGWNRLTLNATARAETIKWQDVPTLRCMDEADRINTNGALDL
ncbi:hypothetical protein EXIGLDRAFT_711213 [Exidia glandulosa HHB12029]|uniref:SGNH hydrolase n=1 Tax=Exidia glandulosa HHB12029 TaxID=1314781 RepID=A0A165QEZ0_EXIGL|nr:hypothetical protein EXIGLDRAFT_711213 [Exidia glandulosa HHB12029]